MRNRPAILMSLCIALLLGVMQSTARAAAIGIDPEPDEVWVLLNTTAQRLEVMLGDYPVVYYQNVAWGRGGVGVKQRQGDEITPVGSFRIRWINRDSQYRLFFGFDYPNPTYADQGLRTGALTPQQHNQIIKAWSQEKVPLQSTSIGGSLGIHGLGRASLDIHQRINWTNGCIALNNTQIDHLSELISIGTRVVIVE